MYVPMKENNPVFRLHQSERVESVTARQLELNASIDGPSPYRYYISMDRMGRMERRVLILGC